MAKLQVPACPDCGGTSWTLVGRSEPLSISGDVRNVRIWLKFQCRSCGLVHDLPVLVEPEPQE